MSDKYDIDIVFVGGKRRSLTEVEDATSGTNIFRYVKGVQVFLFPVANVQSLTARPTDMGTV